MQRLRLPNDRMAAKAKLNAMNDKGKKFGNIDIWDDESKIPSESIKLIFVYILYDRDVFGDDVSWDVLAVIRSMDLSSP